METQALTPEMTARAMAHMNNDHQDSLLAYAHHLADCPWAESAEMVALDGNGFDLAVQGNGRLENQHIAFPQPVTDLMTLRMTMVQLAQQVHEENGLHYAHARVVTPKASRYLKALCNHFSHKVTASYDDQNGRVEFPFGDCTFHAQPDVLLINVSAASSGLLAQVKDVVASHLVRFSQEACQVNWIDGA